MIKIEQQNEILNDADYNQDTKQPHITTQIAIIHTNQATTQQEDTIDNIYQKRIKSKRQQRKFNSLIRESKIHQRKNSLQEIIHPQIKKQQIVEEQADINGVIVVNVLEQIDHNQEQGVTQEFKQLQDKSINQTFSNQKEQSNNKDNIITHQQQQDVQNSIKQDDENQCRICLDSDSSVETGEMLSICECKGSLKFIHRVCLWMQLSSKVKLDEFEKNDQQFKCELCKTPYRIQVGIKYSLNSLQKFKSKLYEQAKTIITFLLLGILSTIFSYVLVEFLDSEEENSKRSSIGFMYYMFISFTITTALVCYIIIIFILIKSCILKKISLLNVFQQKEDYISFQSRTRSSTAASQPQQINIQQVLPYNNEMNV